ncbi:MAG: hypothetical protein ACKN8Z_03785 [Polynucleobacter sp.]
MSTLNGTIYLIDDDDAIRRSLSRMLADVGYDVFDYNSATSFLSNSRVVSPQLFCLICKCPISQAWSYWIASKKMAVQRRLFF